jgi:hypothetical protein
MKRRLIYLSLCILISLNCLFATGSTVSDNTVDNNTLDDYITLDASDDIYRNVQLKGFKPNSDYLKGLRFRQRLVFGIERYDRLNLRANTNVLPRFPYLFMLTGGYSSGRGIEAGFLFRADNLANSRVVLTAATAFGTRSGNNFLLGVEYPAILPEDRLRLFGNIYVTDSSSAYFLQEKSLTFSGFNTYGSGYSLASVGFNVVTGATYRIPTIELQAGGSIDFMYRHNYRLRDPVTDVESAISVNNFGVVAGIDVDWNQQKQTNTIATGNDISLDLNFYIPTTIGDLHSSFRFQSVIEERFAWKFFREFALRFRGILSANAALSGEWSGDPWVRGLAGQELTGWFALLGSVELFLPLLHVDMKSALTIPFSQDAKFILYWVIFVDGGFTIENYSYPLAGDIIRASRQDIKNSLSASDSQGQALLGSGHYLLPAVTVGSGIRIYPYFLPFIIRFDAGFNILKAAIYQDVGECFELTLSFSETF